MRTVGCYSFLYDGKDVFLWLLTGFGKSVYYEVLSFFFDFTGSKSGSVALVISPLVSLMVEQVRSLRKPGVGAAITTGNKGVNACFFPT